VNRRSLDEPGGRRGRDRAHCSVVREYASANAGTLAVLEELPPFKGARGRKIGEPEYRKILQPLGLGLRDADFGPSAVSVRKLQRVELA